MPGDLRSRLIAATAELIERHGPLRVRIDDIAERAGCSRATLYRHTADKDELIREVILARSQVMAGIVAHQIEGITDPTERLAQGMLLFSDALRSETWYKALQAHSGSGAHALARVGGGLEALTSMISPLIEALLREYVDAGHLREDVNSHDAVEWLIGIQLGLLEPFAGHSREHRLAMLKRYAVFQIGRAHV